MHSFSIDGLDLDLRFVRFTGVEGLSRHFRFEVTFLARGEDLAKHDVIGRVAKLGIATGEDVRFVHGIVARIEQGEEKDKTVTHRAVIVPAVHKLLLRKTSRVFQEMTTVDVIEAVLKEAGIAKGVEKRLSASYPSRLYCVQYRESDWDFIARLCEEVGITYFFEHDESGHVLVFADSASAYGAIAGEGNVRFVPPAGSLVTGDHVSLFRAAEQISSDETALRDYDFKKPDLLVEGVAAADKSEGLEVYDFPGEFTAVDHGKQLAKVRLEELTASRRTARGEANTARLVTGATFALVEHPLAELDAKWLLTDVETEGHDPAMFAGSSGTPFALRFTVVPEGTPIRPARVTPRPTLPGAQTALVVGPQGEEIHVDEHGRIKIQFHWDREGTKDDASSCWVRVAQAWAGPGYGAMFLPRVGHEVVVVFLEADPDRPLVTGSVYNGKNVPPYALPAEKTKSSIKTRSSPHGTGANFNELRFEDKKGSEEVLLHAEKDLVVSVENDETRSVGHDQSITVDHDRKRRVTGNEDVTIGKSRTLTVTANETDAIGANYAATVGGNTSITMSGNLGVSLGGAFTEAIEKGATISIGKGKEESIGEGSSEKVGKDKSVQVKGELKTDVEKSASLSVGKNYTTDVDGAMAVTVGDQYVLEVGDAKITVKKNGEITIEGKKVKVKGSDSIQLESGKVTIKSDGPVNVQASGDVKIKGSSIAAN